jgi:hypothetical protein
LRKLGPYIVHPAAEMFPLIVGDEFSQLVQDIKENGLRNPIILDHDELMIIDGRNRYLACEAAGIEPDFECLPYGKDELDFLNYIISVNMRRRELSAGQKGMIGVELEPKIAQAIKEREERRKSTSLPVVDLDTDSQVTGTDPSPHKRAAEIVAKMVDTSATTFKQAKAIKRADPILAEKVAIGEVSVTAAYNRLKEPIEVSEKIREAGELVKQQQEIEPQVSTRIIREIAELNSKLDDIDTHISISHSRWPREWQYKIAESLRAHAEKATILATLLETEEPNIKDLLGDSNA